MLRVYIMPNGKAYQFEDGDVPAGAVLKAAPAEKKPEPKPEVKQAPKPEPVKAKAVEPVKNKAVKPANKAKGAKKK